MSSNFVHLHTHSHYSLLDGLSKIDEIVSLAKEYEMPAVALTDHGNMYGAIEFYKKCKAADIKPIIGVEAYIANRTRFDKEPNIDNKRYHLTLLAKNETGYKNLIKLVTSSYIEGHYYKPRMDKDLLRQHNEGIICLSGCFTGELSRALKNKNEEKAEKIIKEYQDIFGPENYFLEILHHPHIEGNKEIQEGIKKIGKEFDIPLVATQDSHYPHPDDHKVHETLLAIQTSNEKDSFTFGDDDFSFISPEKASEYFKDTPEAVENTLKVAKMCDLELELGKWVFPDLPIKKGSTYDQELRRLTYQGVKERGLEKTLRQNSGQAKEIEERIEYELEIIKKKGYSPYFLVVADLLRFARESKIPSTTRGSAAGSMISYLLGITNINPIKYKLPFERFLNPERPKAPDIDMDFADNRRDEVLEYAKQKYGEDKVAQIGTFGTMMARGAVRDVARALGYPYETGDRIARLIPFGAQGFPMTINKAMEMVPELKQLYQTEKDTKEIIDTARKIEGCARHISVHAAGVVIAPRPLNEFVPTQLDPKGGKIITQYDMHSVEDAGLLKFDFLGITNLAILEDTVDRVKKIRSIDIDIENIPLDDKKTFQMLSRGETMGVFQLGGSGMTHYLKELKPSSIHDINAMVALYRPGPIEFIPKYIERKHNPDLVTYLDPRMKDILGQSYGIITYQDDVLLIAIKIAGYSWLEADKLRKAMGKKIPKEMAAQKEKFIQGCVENGMNPGKAMNLWKLIEPFAAYGFNKCISGDSTLYDAESGEKITVEELYRSRKVPKLLSCEKHHLLQGRRISMVKQNGIKPVYRLTTRRGLQIKATANHPFLKFEGWTEIKDLKVGDKIATARKAPIAAKAYPIEGYKLITLGYLLAEGNLCHPHGVYFYSKKEKELKDFISNAKKFDNVRIKVGRGKPAVSVYIGKSDQKKSNALRDWLEELGLRRKKAAEKNIPSFVYLLNKDQLSLFLAKMWQGDGCISGLRKEGTLFYATSSEEIAYSMQHLLLRLGIISTVHTKKFKYRGGIKKGWTINISRYQNIERFAETIGKYLTGNIKNTIDSVIKNHPIITGEISTVIGRGSKDTIPVTVLPLIKEEIYQAGHSSLKQFAHKVGISERLFWKDKVKRGYLRETIDQIALGLNSKTLNDVANSDIYWDEVVKIEPVGKEMTYDLTIPETHSFVTNDIIVHNSHAASYGRVAYQTAYMKANYPEEYMTAVLTAESGDTEKIAETIKECKRMGFQVLPPSVNESFSDFTIVKDESGNVTNKIRFGLRSIKNFGEEIGKAIIHERKEKGRYSSIADFLERVMHRNLNKKSLEALIMCGAMDEFGERGNLMANMDQLLSYNKEVSEKNQNQGSLFRDLESTSQPQFRLRKEEPATKEEKLAWEKELLGLYVSGHPLDKIKDKLEKREINIQAIKESFRNGTEVTLAGLIEDTRVVTTKQNQRMAFIRIADFSSAIDAVVFPRIFQESSSLFEKENCIALKGRVSLRNGEKSIIIEKAKAI